MAYVVVGFAVFKIERDGNGLMKREKKISPKYTVKEAAEEFMRLAKKYEPKAELVVREITGHEG